MVLSTYLLGADSTLIFPRFNTTAARNAKVYPEMVTPSILGSLNGAQGGKKKENLDS